MRCVDKSMVSFGHNDIVLDNAYFWRSAEGALEFGLFDWQQSCLNNVGQEWAWNLHFLLPEFLTAHEDEFISLILEVSSRSAGQVALAPSFGSSVYSLLSDVLSARRSHPSFSLPSSIRARHRPNVRLRWCWSAAAAQLIAWTWPLRRSAGITFDNPIQSPYREWTTPLISP